MWGIMGRYRFSLAKSVLSHAALSVAVLLSSGTHLGFAKPKKAAPASTKASKPSAEAQKAVTDFMGPYKFGMSKDEVLGVLRKQLDARYKAEMEATADVYRQDQLQTAKKLEVDRLGKSFTEFDGKKTGWDVSIVDGEFVHNNGESLLEFWENSGGKNQRRFFFFYQGRLYKMVIALDAKQVSQEQRTFEFFTGLMEQRLGAATKNGTAISWKVNGTNVEAFDELEFYNAFCLAFADAKLLADVSSSRAALGTKPKEENKLIKSITADKDDDGPSLDAGKDAVDKVIKGR